ncbi:MAG: transglutaminase domain-containing protein [Candidatus Aminicenantales bacterium]
MSEKHTSTAASAVGVLFAITFAFAAARPVSAQSWPPLTPEEKAMTDCPQQPGADAVWLYREEITDHEALETKIFKRMKILKDSGRDRANIEIPYYAGSWKVDGLEIRHIPPQGQPLPFTGQVLDKTALRYRRFRVAVKTFAVPNVTVGSIIEFRYSIVRDYGRSSGADQEDMADNLSLAGSKPEEGGLPKNKEYLSFPAIHWEVQDDLFTRKIKYEYIGHPYIWLLFDGPCRLTWVCHRLEAARPEIKGTRVLLELENVPAFEDEEFMTSEKAEQMSVDVFYLDRRITGSDEFWKRESQIWQRNAENFIGDARKSTPRALELVGDAEDAVVKLNRIYDGAQKIRNLSYEKGLSRKQRKEQNIKRNRSAADVLERGYGVRSDITRTFVALARAAGFQAEVVRVSTRDDKLFRINLLSFYDQMDSEAAIVVLGDKSLLFDPATPFCPFGLVHWSRSNTAALRYAEKPPAFFVTTIYQPELALTQREIALTLDPQGGLSGTVKTTYTGHEALVRRLEHIHDDAEARKTDLEKELADVLPPGTTVTLTNLVNIDNSARDLVASYEVSIPGIATAAGEKVLLPVSPLLGAARYPFRTTGRKYPVYFPYPFREFDDIVITLPEGLTAEVRPAPRKDESDFSAYSLVCADEGPGKIHVQRDFVIKKSFFPVEQYAAVKASFDSVRASDEAQVIFTTVKKEP